MKLRCMKKMNKLVSIVLILMLLFSTAVSAEGPYNNYNYDPNSSSGDALPTAAGYLPDTLITGDTLGVGALNAPKDMYYDNNQYLYILDSGNSRIVVLNKQYKVDHIITPKDKTGNALQFQNANGLYIGKTGRIFVADTDAQLIYVFNSDGVMQNQIGAPVSDVVPDGFDYKPTKVLEDTSGIVYVISDGCIYGALVYNKDYQFTGFFGSDTVTLSAQVVANQIWKRILPKSMQQSLIRAIPVEYNNFDMDSQGLIYTCKIDKDASGGQVRKLNYNGYNTLWYRQNNVVGKYGDLKTSTDKSGTIMTELSDVDVDPQGFINVLDRRRDRVFQYDQDSNLLFIFGGSTSQFGCFEEPSAVESIDGNVLVLDSKAATITLMKPTYFANQVHTATLLYKDGKYGEAKDLWKEVLRYDSNYSVANVGLAKAFETEGNYKEALSYYKTANDKVDYSDAYYQYRYNQLHQWFGFIMAAVIALIVAPLIISAVKRRRRKNDYYVEISALRYPFYTMNHPFKGFTALKDEKRGSMLAANIILLLFFIINIFVKQNTGFLFRTDRPEDFNILYTLVGTVGIFVLWVVANWALSTLMDGEGRFTEIWIFSAYSLLPFVLFMIPLSLLSNVLVNDEAAFFGIFQFFIYAWVCVCMLMAIREVHQFTTGKTILSILGTVLGMVIMAGIYALVYSMFTQLIGFIGTIVNEISLRL